MELKRKNYLVAAVVAGIVLGLIVGLVEQARQGDSAARSPATALGAAPTRDELRRTVTAMFSRNASGAAHGARMPLSPGFVKDKTMFGRFLELAGARDVRPVVAGVRGRSADVVIDYTLVSDTKVRMVFRRRDSWAFTRGNGGWLLDAISVNDEIFRRLVFPDGSIQNVTHSRYDAASGSVTFSLRNRSYVWTPDSHWGWKIVALGTPKPAPTPIAPDTPAPSPAPPALIAAQTPPATMKPSHASPASAPSPRPAASAVPATAAHPSPAAIVRASPAAHGVATETRVAFAAAGPYSDCSIETVDSVSEDGSVVTLAGGRRYLIREAQRYLSAMWIAEDEVTVCDPGPEMDARITHRGDVVYAGHSE